MAIQHSDGLSLLVGDGEVSEAFTALRGLTVSRLEVEQVLHMATAVAADAWQNGVGTSQRRVVIACEALANDEAAALRLRGLAIGGASGNIQLELAGSETLECAVYVTEYREVIQAGQVKRLVCRLESSGAVSVAAL